MSRLARDANSQPIQCLRPSTGQSVNVSGTAASSTSITQRVTRIVSTVDVHYSVEGTATTTDCFLPANFVEFIHTYEGDTISFITSGSTGTVYVTEMI
jgi:hypothetical protein